MGKFVFRLSLVVGAYGPFTERHAYISFWRLVQVCRCFSAKNFHQFVPDRIVRVISA